MGFIDVGGCVFVGGLAHKASPYGDLWCCRGDPHGRPKCEC